MKYIRPYFDIKDYGWLRFHCEMVGLDPVIFAVATLLKIPKFPTELMGFVTETWNTSLISFPFNFLGG